MNAGRFHIFFCWFSKGIHLSGTNGLRKPQVDNYHVESRPAGMLCSILYALALQLFVSFVRTGGGGSDIYAFLYNPLMTYTGRQSSECSPKIHTLEMQEALARCLSAIVRVVWVIKADVTRRQIDRASERPSASVRAKYGIGDCVPEQRPVGRTEVCSQFHNHSLCTIRIPHK